MLAADTELDAASLGLVRNVRRYDLEHDGERQRCDRRADFVPRRIKRKHDLACPRDPQQIEHAFGLRGVERAEALRDLQQGRDSAARVG